jgi:lipoprotein-anchoring transpeptidase ErfK/SrfK
VEVIEFRVGKLRQAGTWARFAVWISTMFICVLMAIPGQTMESVPGDTPDAGQMSSSQTVDSKFPVLMKTRRVTPVRRSWHDDSAILAKVKKGAVLRMRWRRETSSSCPEGWLERSNKGFVCAKYLHREKELQESPSPLDAPDILNGLEPVKVIRDRSRIYRALKHIRPDRPFIILNEGSLLMVQGKVVHEGAAYFQTRKGWYVSADNVVKLAPVIESLAVDIQPGEHPPGAIVTSDDVAVFSQPDSSAEPVRTLQRWSVIAGIEGRPLKAENAWVKLPDGSFVPDEHLSRIRPVPVPEDIKPGEKWIAVDLKEQLLHAYEGDRLVRVIPCSTGMEDNTEPGNYRIQWKRRMQTLRPEDRLRVEDVQWVMYYYPPKGIAIHATYWHGDFGKPVSHGCVNLPVRDARWAFEWSAPLVLAEDSERFPLPRGSGTRVVVFDE